jgi:hypothetical protein
VIATEASQELQPDPNQSEIPNDFPTTIEELV